MYVVVQCARLASGLCTSNRGPSWGVLHSGQRKQGEWQLAATREVTRIEGGAQRLTLQRGRKARTTTKPLRSREISKMR